MAESRSEAISVEFEFESKISSALSSDTEGWVKIKLCVSTFFFRTETAEVKGRFIMSENCIENEVFLH